MNLDDRLRRVGLLCLHFSRNLAYYKAGWDSGKLKKTSEFWVTVNGNSLDICVLEWCKLFGNRNDAHHWKKITELDGKSEYFRINMFAELNISQIDLNDYWKELKNYRDNFVAHLESEKTMLIPKLDIAFNTVKFYFKYIHEHPLGRVALVGLPASISEYYDSCFKEASKVFSSKT